MPDAVRASSAARKYAGASGVGYEGPGPFAVAWRDRWRLLAVALVTAAATYAVSMQSAPVYVATTTMAYPVSGSDAALSGGDAERSRSLRTEAERITSYALLQHAVKEIGRGIDVETLASQVSAIPASNADVVTVRATAATPDLAAEIADEVGAAYRRQVDRRQRRSLDNLEQQSARLQKRITSQQKQLAEQLQAAAVRENDGQVQANADPAVAASRLALEATASQLSNVQMRMDQVTAQQESAAGRIQVLRPADLPDRPEHPRPLRNAATMVVLALMLAVTIRWWLADPDPPMVDDSQIVELALGAPVIAEIPPLGGATPAAGIVRDDFLHVINAYRMVAAMIPLRGAVLVTAAGANECCSDVALNVAAVLRRDGYRAIVVEGDNQVSQLRPGPREPSPGLTDVASRRATVEACLLTDTTDGGAGIGLLPWGTGQTGLPRGERSGLTQALEELSALVDLVLVDGPPLASSADAVNLAGTVDGILLTVTIGTPLSDLSRLRARLNQLDRPVLGVIVRHPPERRFGRRSLRTATTPPAWATLGARERAT